MNNQYNPYEPDGKSNSDSKIKVEFKKHISHSMKKKGMGTVNAGGAIIIIIFVVLCLTIFGLLSFTTSFADKKLADRNLDSVVRYYKADSEAEEKLAIIYDALYTRILLTSGPAYFFDEAFVKSTVENIAGYDFSDIVTIKEESPIDNWDLLEFYDEDEEEKINNSINIVTVIYQTQISDQEYSDDSKIKFYLNSEVEFCYNQDLNSFTYKIKEWKVVLDIASDVVYGEEEYNFFNPNSFWGDE